MMPFKIVCLVNDTKAYLKVKALCPNPNKNRCQSMDHNIIGAEQTAPA